MRTRPPTVGSAGTRRCNAFVAGSGVAVVLVAVVAALALGASHASADSGTFPNASAITVTDRACPAGSPPGLANAYPSNITVSGLNGNVSKVTVSLKGVTHAFPGDFDVLLMGPAGQNLKVMSDAGGQATTNVNLTFDDAAAGTLPQSAALVTGTYKVSDYTEAGFPDTFPSPAPAPSAATDLSTFNGTNPNGVWKLYVVDDACGDAGSFGGGWSLDITTNTGAASTTSVTSSLNPALTGQPVTFTATVTSGGSPVTSGSFTFKEGATVLSGPTNVDAAGRATFTTSSLSEGVHVVTAQYNGNASFSPSSANVSETLDNPTTGTAPSYCNAGSISGGNGAPGTGTPYPSRTFVTGQSGLTSKVTLTLKNVTHAFPGDFDMLLVGPGGQNLKVVSDAGNPPGATATNNVTVTFDDAAAGQLPATGPWGAANSTITARPTDINEAGFPDVFPSPAPAVTGSPAPTGAATLGVFNGLSPNGTWSLYVTDDSLGDIGTIAGGWCLNFTTSPGSVTSTAVGSSLNPSLSGQSVTFTATVTSGGSPVNTGSVTFKEGATVLSGPTNVNGSGQASFSTASLTEGAHVITAQYSGTASLGPSSGTVTQTVDRTTTQTGTTYCNTGQITINQVDAATPYPSHISVTGFPVTTSKVTVTLKGVTHPYPGDIDALLVAPTGQNLTLVSDAGTATTTNVTATFDDSAASSLAATGAWGAPNASVTSKPVNYEGSVDVFPSPAPSPSAATTLATFSGIAPAGTWSLYVADDSVGDAGSIANGWCISLTPVKASPTLTTTASAGVGVGGQVHDTAALAGGGGPSGTITFKLYGPNDATCANAAVSTTTATVNAGNGSYDSPTFTTTAPGTYRWTADYGGDTNNNTATSACNAANESVVVSKASPTLTTTASAGVGVGGQVHDTAAVAAGFSPTGTITFKLYGPNDATCANAAVSTTTATVNAGNGSYDSPTFTTTAPGTYRWTADYGGDTNNNTATSACNAANESVAVVVGGRYTPLTSARILDTRDGTGAPVGQVGPGSTTLLQVTGRGGVPASGVAAVAMNVAVTNPSSLSFLSLYPSGQAQPLAANLNFKADQTVSNLVVVKVGADGKVAIFNQAGSTDVVADVAGWFSDPSAGNDGRLQPLSPTLILDSRNGTGGGVRLGPGQSFDMQVAGAGGVPATGAEAAVINVEATNTDAQSYLTAYPTGQPRPSTANLNWVSGLTVSNRAMVKLGTGGKVTLYNNSGSTDVVVDVNGWYTDTSVAGTNGTYTALAPARILDTRDGTGGISGPVGPGATIDVQVAGQGGVPASGATTVVLNVAVTQPSAAGTFTLFPTGGAQPAPVDMNFAPGENRSHLVVVKLGAGGKVSLFNQFGSAHVVIDVAGWLS